MTEHIAYSDPIATIASSQHFIIGRYFYLFILKYGFRYIYIYKLTVQIQAIKVVTSNLSVVHRQYYGVEILF